MSWLVREVLDLVAAFSVVKVQPYASVREVTVRRGTLLVRQDLNVIELG